MSSDGFYGREQAAIHHERFGDLALDAAGCSPGSSSAAGSPTGTVTDLGCGSGILARMMSDLGYDVARHRHLAGHARARRTQRAPRRRSGSESLVDAAIPPSVAVTAIGEALNYATDPRAGLDATDDASRAASYDALAPGGIFLFDVATPGRNLGLDVRERIHDHDDWMLSMHATETGDRLDRRITIYTREADGRYTRTDEHHVIHLYDANALARCSSTSASTVETAAELRARPLATRPRRRAGPCSSRRSRARRPLGRGGRPIVLVSRYSSKPAMPCSRPRPDSL